MKKLIIGIVFLIPCFLRAVDYSRTSGDLFSQGNDILLGVSGTVHDGMNGGSVIVGRSINDRVGLQMEIGYTKCREEFSYNVTPSSTSLASSVPFSDFQTDEVFLSLSSRRAFGKLVISGTLGASQETRRRLRSGSNGLIAHNDYPVNHLVYGAGASYKVASWLDMGVAYDNRRRLSVNTVIRFKGVID